MDRRLSRAVLITTLHPTLGFLPPRTLLPYPPATSSFPPSPWLVSSASSLAAQKAQGPTRTEMAASPDNHENILEPQGTHYSWYSLKPLTDAAEWISTPGAYFKKCSEAVEGASVFKMHPGLACIGLTDHASGKWFFEQPDTVLDRQVSWASLSKRYRVQGGPKAVHVRAQGVGYVHRGAAFYWVVVLSYYLTLVSGINS